MSADQTPRTPRSALSERTVNGNALTARLTGRTWRSCGACAWNGTECAPDGWCACAGCCAAAATTLTPYQKSIGDLL